jgi:hypothetical protein
MHFEHYRNKYQTVDIAKDWNLSGPLFNVLKYIQRRGRKDGYSNEQDLLKAIWYLVYELTSNKDVCNKIIEQLGIPLYKAKINEACPCPECKKTRLMTQKEL